MHSLNVMHDYYAGQKLVGIVSGSVAALLVLIGVLAFRQAAHPAHAFGLTTLIIAGGFILPANVAYYFYVGPQTARIESMLKRSPTEFRASEDKHLDKCSVASRAATPLIAWPSPSACTSRSSATFGRIPGN